MLLLPLFFVQNQPISFVHRLPELLPAESFCCSQPAFFFLTRYWCCKFYENSHSRTSFTAWSSMIRFFVWLPYSSRLVHTLSITLAVPALY